MKPAPETALAKAEQNPLAIPASEAAVTSAIVEAAKNPDFSPEAFKVLVEAQRDMRKDQERRAFFTALHGFQKACPQLVKDSIIPNKAKDGKPATVRSKYSKFEDMMRVIQPIMIANGLTATFDNEVDPEGNLCAKTCTVHHIEGHSETHRFPIKRDASQFMTPNQQIGSGSSFASRYAIGAALGLVFCDEDNDANDPEPEPVTPEQANELDGLLGELEALEHGGAKRFIDWAGVKDCAQLPASRFAECLDLVERKIKKLAEAAE